MAIPADAARSRLEAALKTGAVLARFHDVETAAHLAGVARCTRVLASAVAPSWGLSPGVVSAIQLFSVVHDIGKVAVPGELLARNGPLDTDEMARMQAHTTAGAEIVDLLVARVGLQENAHLPLLRRIVRSHHENLDGSGYPDGLSGDAITAEVRIVAVADVYDALRSERPYKPSWPRADVLAHLRETRGRLYDADCVDAAFAHADELEGFRRPAAARR